MRSHQLISAAHLVNQTPHRAQTAMCRTTDFAPASSHCPSSHRQFAFSSTLPFSSPTHLHLRKSLSHLRHPRLCTPPQPRPVLPRRTASVSAVAAEDQPQPPPSTTSAAIPPEIIHTANKAADAAAAIIRQYFRQPFDVSFKQDQSPVTIADKHAEHAIRNVITQAFPHHQIIGEEHGSTSSPSHTEYVWVIDPIDGTKAFMTGRPTFATLIAVARNNVPILGIIDQPISRERWVGIANEQTTLNGVPVQVRPPPNLSDSILQATTPDMFIGYEALLFRRLSKQVKNVVYGADCYAYALLASGCAHLVVEADLKPWDFMALVPVVSGAGGYIAGWNGLSLSLHSEGRVIAAAGEHLFSQVVEILNPLDEMGLYPGPMTSIHVPEEKPEDPGEGCIESMTGFGTGSAEAAGYRVDAQARSVNSRYCDVQIKCPSYLAIKNNELVSMVKREVRRGKLIINVDVTAEGSPDSIVSVAVDRKAAAEVRQLLDDVADAAGVKQEPTISDVLGFSEVLARAGRGTTTEHVLPVAKQAVMEAIRDLRAARRIEGAILENDILQRTKKIKKIAEDIGYRLPQRVEAKRKHLFELTDGLNGKVDKDRLEAEVTLFADRIDVSEELVRLRAHVQVFELSFLGADEPVGQRLVFLLQEMHREVTTMSDKCYDSAVMHLAVMIKEEIEKIREQCVNIR